MIKNNDKKNIHKQVKKDIINVSHGKFRNMLINKAREYPWCKIRIVSEEYTTQTCGKCGILNKKVGSKKIFKCNECKYTIGRDINGARNILIKYLTESKITI